MHTTLIAPHNQQITLDKLGIFSNDFYRMIFSNIDKKNLRLARRNAGITKFTELLKPMVKRGIHVGILAN
jgi:hypothetical protein